MFFRLHRFLFASIRGRLTLLVAAVTIPTGGLAATLMIQAYRNQRAVVESHLSATARSFTLQVDHQLLDREGLLKGLLGSPALEKEDWSAFYAQAKAIAGGQDQWIVLIDASGQQMLNTSQPFGASLPRVRFRPEFREAAERGRTYVSNLILGPARQSYAIFTAIPIFRQGRLVYTLNFAMLPSVLGDWMLKGEAPKTWIISLLDREGTIAARSRSTETYVGKKSRPIVLEAVNGPSGDAILGGKTLEGIEIMTAFSRCAISGWSVVVGVPRAELYASAWHLLWVAVAFFSASFLILLSVTLWIVHGILRAMESLVRDATFLGRGGALTAASSGLIETDLVADALRGAATQLRAREADLKQLNENLDLRVQTRTRELADANRELDSFARIASHDLKEPLRLMNAYASILRVEHYDQLDEAARMYVDRIEVSAQRQRKLIDAILAYSRLGSTEPRLEMVNLDQVLEIVRSDLEKRLSETSGSIEANTLGTIMGDPTQLHQLLLNLVGNGLKFHRPGVPPVVRIRAERKSDEMHLMVEDNGLGFEMRYVDRIFSPFERLHSGSQYDGTGMGLAIVRRVAERHKGRVRADSVLGQGSRFEVVLPIE